jgi:hypothetical protein
MRQPIHENNFKTFLTSFRSIAEPEVYGELVSFASVVLEAILTSEQKLPPPEEIETKNILTPVRFTLNETLRVVQGYRFYMVIKFSGIATTDAYCFLETNADDRAVKLYLEDDVINWREG